MVAYGKKLKNARRPGWEKAYLEYDALKDLLEQDLRDSFTKTFQSMEDITAVTTTSAAHRQQSCARFLTALELEIEKVSLFTLSRQGELAEAIGAYRFPHYKILASTTIDLAPVVIPAPIPPPPPIQQQPSSDESADLLFSSPILKRSGEKVASLPSFTRRGSFQTGSNGTVLRPMFRAPESMRSFVENALSSTDPETATTPTITTTTPTSASLTVIAIELLHLLRFICVNAAGIRKILKKYDKLWLAIKDDDSVQSDNANDKAGREAVLSYADHIQQLANAASISAVHASLDSALKTILAAETATTTSTPSQPSVGTVRLQCAMEAIQVLREYAAIVNQPFSEYLSRRAMIVTGKDREERKALLAVLWFNPDTLAQTPDAELLAWWWKRSASMPLHHHRRLSTTVISIDDVVMDLVESDFVVDQADSWGGVSTASLVINLVSTLLYTVNYYIIAPTANHYAVNLGTDGAFGSTLIGASSFAAIFAAFLYSFWYTKSSFRSALLFSTVCPLLGNFLYAIAISYKSMNMALAGRVLCGFGSAEVANRQLISACVSFSNMTRASALFVASSALGMGVGPLVAGILENVFGTDMQVDIQMTFLPRGGIIVNHITSPALVMSILWFLEMLAICFLFHEPDRIHGGGGNGGSSSSGVKKASNISSNGSAMHEYTGALTNYGSTSSLKELDETYDEEKNWLLKSDNGIPHKRPGNTFRDQVAAIYKLVFANAALPVTLYVFAFIELVDEVLISSCSMVVHRYFGWKGSVAGFLIASLGSLVLPADFLVERMSHVHSERKIMKNSLIFLIVCMVLILNLEGFILDIVGDVEGKDASFEGSKLRSYLNNKGEFHYDWRWGRYVYIFFLSAIFMGTIVLEGVDTSMMSRVTPPGLNDTFINCGLLATLIGTFGRVAGDSMITISALVDKNIFTDFVNATFFPLIPLALFGFWLVIRYYKQFV